MKEVFSHLSIMLGALVAVLTLLDWLMSVRTKKIVKNKVELLWFKCNEWNKINFFQFLRNSTLLIIIFLLFVVLFSFAFVNESDRNSFLVITVFSVPIFPKLIKWINRSEYFGDTYFKAFMLIYFLELVSPSSSNFSFWLLLPIRIGLIGIYFFGILIIALTLLVKLLLNVFELITLRIAEHEKGAVLGFTALLIILGAVIKIFF